MINQDFDVLKNWMFGSLASLLDGKSPNPKLKILKMSIGEPQLAPPDFVRDKFDKFFDDWGKYPPSEPIPKLKNAIKKYLDKDEKFDIIENNISKIKDYIHTKIK